MSLTGRPAASNRPMARRVVMRRAGSGRRVAAIACLAGLAGVAIVGMLHPLSAAGGGQPTATNVLSASTGVGSVWGSSDTTGSMNWIDLITKVTIVLALLFITLRFLGRMGAGAQKRGGLLQVLESRTLAPKASLHLVAIGDRRLVVGLTPSGMVSLAELDATELDTEEAAALAAETAPVSGAIAAAMRPAQPTLRSALTSAVWPLDILTGRLSTFLNGGRVR
jgi:flagellar biosynthetic protein FliO